jgi:hypothetical protein
MTNPRSLFDSRARATLIAGVVLMLFVPATRTVAQTASGAAVQEPPLTERERMFMERIQNLESRLAALEAKTAASAELPVPAAPVDSNNNSDTDTGTAGIAPEVKEKIGFGIYTPNLGYKVADTNYGDLSVSIYTYVRYLNQLGLAPTYTDAFGNTKTVQQRQDMQLQKVQIKFLGWVINPKLRYFLYVWTNNANQGQGAQVVVAGNVNYNFNKHFTLAGGITSLPGTRSVEGNFPFWITPDSRMIADEFFRPSYTTGIWARGLIVDRVRYQVMLGNNLSTLGVAANQLDNHFNTFASALVWNPTGSDYGIGFGDFENHETPSTRLAAHFTSSTEDKQSQPNSDSIENTQLRLSDGSVIFTPNLFGPGISITRAKYKMVNVDGGVKYHGLELLGSYYVRWLGNFLGPGTPGLRSLFDQGLEVQVSKMVVPKTTQLYLGGSVIFGQYGTPFDTRAGVNIFPFKNKVVRWNTEVLYLNKSPVGYTAVPFALGGKGFVYHSTVELAF